MGDILYKIKDLEIKSYSEDGHLVILDKINLTIKKGEKLGLIGETGSGKSMLASALMDLVPRGCLISGGAISHYFDSFRSTSSPRGVKVSMISQDPMQSLNPLQTIETQFSIILMKRFGYNKNKAREHILKWVQKVYLHEVPGILDRYPHQLSGGQMQRVMIALAMSVDPEFIIADEITTGLDANIKMEILNLLFSFQKDLKISVLLISHDLISVQKYCDRIAVLNSGKIIDVDDTKTIINKSDDEYTKIFSRLPNKTPKQKSKNNSDPILFVKDLYKTYGSNKHTVSALNGVTLEIYKRETLGVIGESGSGKTTLVKTTLNILERDSGDMILRTNSNERNLTKPSRKIGAVFQDSMGSLNPRMDVYDILREPLILKGVKDPKTIKTKIIGMLEKVHLGLNLLQSFPDQLSGGQRHRVSIARALMLDPRILILDEPTSALDIYTQEKILDLLKEIQTQNNLSFIFISHDLGVVSEISDRIAVLYKGNIIESGKTNDVFINPSHDYTKKLIDSNAWMDKNANI